MYYCGYIAVRLREIQDALLDLGKFCKMIELVLFAFFKGAVQALENAKDVSEMRELLWVFRSKTWVTPYVDSLFNNIAQGFSKYIRVHGLKLLKDSQEGVIERAKLGLGHAFSKVKVKFTVQKNGANIS
ncbi:hypothetical protein METBIDRAFT_230741 [Metschnikowia bicuspidata var. bicuspidata NRRL YB-4993]|uniref:Nucleolar protein 58/56 N-terminal domain-containing protein n=1 Tax=Metschnikowia bicuspidata var. bicuspidata NRRL YB-4993 TaxID=869754 RepID=A0A1A0H291_9ASCO|nr:hypothetical protein METBIDRAFT_230741 [Metschnikowia bicuspidata var. bicuspidata NRRL YB-4993]OBA18070.1 hypothetical protein METBIDRAFT_230741 [Metschnikowia bicuspidata var. bicuspidata NRRL YB-4993]